MCKQVYIVEDSEFLRDITAQYISLQPGLEVCGAAACAERALDELPAGADVVAIDLSLGKGLSGLELVAAIRERWPDLPCIVLSGQPERHVGESVRAAGAAAYIEKGDQEHLIDVLYNVLGMAGGITP